MNKVKTYNVSSEFAVVIANSDTTGLNESDELAFNNWEVNLPVNTYAVVTDSDLGWGRCEITGFSSELIEVSIYSTGVKPRDTGEDFIYDDQGMPWLFDE